MPLEDYKDIVATSASVTTIAQMFSGVFICYDIVKQRSTENIDVMPFLGGTAMSALFLEYSNIMNDPAMTRVNWVGLFLNLGYFLCYYVYTDDKKSVHFKSLVASLFVGVFILYAKLESPDVVEFRYGTLITVLLMLLIASPLFSLKEIIRTKSTATLPFPLIVTGTLVSFQWLLYGIIIKNEIIQFQNMIGFGLSVIQLSLFAIYPRTPRKKSD